MLEKFKKTIRKSLGILDFPQSVMQNIITNEIDTQINIKTGWVFACINKIAKSTSVLKLFVERETKDGYVLDRDNWLQMLIEKPNKYYDMTTLIELYIHSLYNFGKVFIWMPAERLPYSLQILPTKSVKINRNNNYDIISYTLSAGTWQRTFSVEEIIYINTLSPDTLLSTFNDGVPIVLNAALDAVLTEREKLRFNRRVMNRDAAAPYVITNESDLDSAQAELMRMQIFENTPAEFRPKTVLSGGNKIELISSSTAANSISDISYNDLVEQITAIFQIPMTLLTGKDANKSTNISNINDFYTTVVHSNLEKLINSINNRLIEFDNYYINYERYKELDYDYLLRENEFFLNYGIKTINEIRKDYDLSEVENGDERLIKFGLQKLSDITDDYVMPEVKTIAKSGDELVKNIYWKKYDIINQQRKLQLRRIIKSVFNNLLNEILDNDIILQNKSNKSFVISDNLFNIDKWKGIAEVQTEAWRRKLILLIFESAKRDVGSNLSLTEFEKQIAVISKVSTSKIVNSFDTIHGELRQSIQNIVEANPTANINELRENIKTNIQSKFRKVLSNSRVNNIAQTTTTYTVAKTQKEVWKTESGIKTAWLSERDGVVRETHLAADGTYPDDSGLFSVGSDKMECPGGGNLAEENCNCRCVLYPQKSMF